MNHSPSLQRQQGVESQDDGDGKEDYNFHPDEEDLLSAVELLELVDDGTTSPRRELLLSLKQLEDILKEDTSIAMSGEKLDVEEFLEEFRRQCLGYCTVEIPNVRSQLLLLQTKLSPTLLLRSLVSYGTSWQLPRERDVIQDVMSHLGSFYSCWDPRHVVSSTQLEWVSPLPSLVSKAIACLGRATLAAQPDAIFTLRLCANARRQQCPNLFELKRGRSLTSQNFETRQRPKRFIPPDHNVLRAETPVEALEVLLKETAASRHHVSTTICLSGPEGKTYFCNQVCSKVHDAIRLHIPIDLLGSTKGFAERVILGKFQRLAQKEPKRVLVLDDVHLLTAEQMESTSRAIEWMKTLSFGSSLVIITCPEDKVLKHRIQADKTFQLSLPGTLERSTLLATMWKMSIPNDIVAATAGKSRAEIMHLSRQSLLSTNTTGKLQHFRHRLAAATPESLKKGLVDDSLGWQVWGPQEIEQNYIGPLQGPSASKAWNRLQNNLLLPLTRSVELAQILGVAPKNTMSLGALITGDSGSGKTSLARQCAHFAACPLITVSCPTLLRQHVGGSEKTLTRLLQAARRASPCILLLEHLEAIAAVRGNDMTTEGTMDRLLSTLLVELDGVQDQSSGLIAVIGTTIDSTWIDPSLIRPGRLEHVVHLVRD